MSQMSKSSEGIQRCCRSVLRAALMWQPTEQSAYVAVSRGSELDTLKHVVEARQ